MWCERERDLLRKREREWEDGVASTSWFKGQGIRCRSLPFGNNKNSFLKFEMEFWKDEERKREREWETKTEWQR